MTKAKTKKIELTSEEMDTLRIALSHSARTNRDNGHSDKAEECMVLWDKLVKLRF